MPVGVVVTAPMPVPAVATVSMALFVSVNTTAAETVVLPAASRATAVRVWLPSATVVVSQASEYGAAVSSAPRAAPSSRSCTPTTPVLSPAVATTVTVPLTTLAAIGAVIATVGARVSETVKVSALESPPPGAGLETLTDTVPAVAMSAAAIAALSWVLDTGVVVRAAPFHFTTAPATKLVPLTVRVNDGPPEAVLFGDSEPRV